MRKEASPGTYAPEDSNWSELVESVDLGQISEPEFAALLAEAEEFGADPEHTIRQAAAFIGSTDPEAIRHYLHDIASPPGS